MLTTDSRESVYRCINYTSAWTRPDFHCPSVFRRRRRSKEVEKKEVREKKDHRLDVVGVFTKRIRDLRYNGLRSAIFESRHQQSEPSSSQSFPSDPCNLIGQKCRMIDRNLNLIGR